MCKTPVTRFTLQRYNKYCIYARLLSKKYHFLKFLCHFYTLLYDIKSFVLHSKYGIAAFLLEQKQKIISN